MQQLVKHSSKSNPVAVIKSKSSGKTRAKGIRAHFDSELPSASLMCVGCRVAINSRNFQPSWGLHNGACGTVEEIIFSKGESPNTGHMPLYVVVNFPLYCGPAWDSDNPKVCQHQIAYPASCAHPASLTKTNVHSSYQFLQRRSSARNNAVKEFSVL